MVQFFDKRYSGRGSSTPVSSSKPPSAARFLYTDVKPDPDGNESVDSDMEFSTDKDFAGKTHPDECIPFQCADMTDDVLFSNSSQKTSVVTSFPTEGLMKRRGDQVQSPFPSKSRRTTERQLISDVPSKRAEVIKTLQLAKDVLSTKMTDTLRCVTLLFIFFQCSEEMKCC